MMLRKDKLRLSRKMKSFSDSHTKLLKHNKLKHKLRQPIIMLKEKESCLILTIWASIQVVI